MYVLSLRCAVKDIHQAVYLSTEIGTYMDFKNLTAYRIYYSLSIYWKDVLKQTNPYNAKISRKITNSKWCPRNTLFYTLNILWDYLRLFYIFVFNIQTELSAATLMKTKIGCWSMKTYLPYNVTQTSQILSIPKRQWWYIMSGSAFPCDF